MYYIFHFGIISQKYIYNIFLNNRDECEYMTQNYVVGFPISGEILRSAYAQCKGSVPFWENPISVATGTPLPGKYKRKIIIVFFFLRNKERKEERKFQ